MAKRKPEPFDPDALVDAFEATVKRGDAEAVKRAALAAARAAVVKAAMAMRSTMCPAMETAGDHYMVIDRNGPEWQAYNAACADLAALEGK